MSGSHGIYQSSLEAKKPFDWKTKRQVEPLDLYSQLSIMLCTFIEDCTNSFKGQISHISMIESRGYSSDTEHQSLNILLDLK